MKKKTSIIKKTNYFIVTQKSYPAETCKIVDLIIHYKEPGKEDVHIPMKDIETMKGVQYIKKEDIKKITKPLFDPLEFEFDHSYILFSQLQSAKVELGEDACRELHIKLSSISAPLYDYVKTSPYYKCFVCESDILEIFTGVALLGAVDFHFVLAPFFLIVRIVFCYIGYVIYNHPLT